MHDKAHEPQTESRPGIRIARSLRLHSFRLGIIGQADVVEFHKAENGIKLEDAEGFWRPIPVEYKRGAPKTGHCDIIQLCAQAICLEEMLGASIEKGALFYGRPRRRQEVVFTDELRTETAELAAKLHELVKGGKTPKASYEKKCDNCSLIGVCMPKITGTHKNIARYLSNARKSTEEPEP